MAPSTKTEQRRIRPSERLGDVRGGNDLTWRKVVADTMPILRQPCGLSADFFVAGSDASPGKARLQFGEPVQGGSARFAAAFTRRCLAVARGV